VDTAHLQNEDIEDLHNTEESTGIEIVLAMMFWMLTKMEGTAGHVEGVGIVIQN
jgi:hypothetical protein